MNWVAMLRLTLGEPNETEALKGVSGLAAVPGALVGMVLAMPLFVSERSSAGVIAGAMAGGGLGGGLLALGLVKSAARGVGFGSVAWVPLAFGGVVAGLSIEVAVGLISWTWLPFGALAGLLAIAGVIGTYRLRGRRARGGGGPPAGP